MAPHRVSSRVLLPWGLSGDHVSKRVTASLWATSVIRPDCPFGSQARSSLWNTRLIKPEPGPRLNVREDHKDSTPESMSFVATDTS